ncbi:MAG: CDP-alcohol phosphatidyltransferase family protein [Leptospiraceae bacterium]|nr:CDP-alcohol phosphatidyltransferase family protein [Leptospiraceae bacterium]MDW8306498.1 CDP-alcohol phosphatidyltransferase family protein [Leptospiraceae bacterium]
MKINPTKHLWRTWIPNGLSIGNLVFGFFSIVISSHSLKSPGHELNLFLLAALFIIIAAFFDGMDGPLARALNAQSPLGSHLDSLADLTTFGLAPGALMYFMYLSDIKYPISGWKYPLPIGLIIASLFPICAAYRLARFNVAHDSRSFTGLPSPVAGLSVAFLPFLTKYAGPLPLKFTLSLFIIMAILMVSNIRYSKPQAKFLAHLNWLRLFFFAVVVVLLMLWLGWYWVILGVTILYIFSGLVSLFLNMLQKIPFWKRH